MQRSRGHREGNSSLVKHTVDTCQEAKQKKRQKTDRDVERGKDGGTGQSREGDLMKITFS